MLIQEFLHRTIAAWPDEPALVCDGKRTRYRDIGGMSSRLAAALQQRHVVRGDRVAIFMENSLEAVVAIYAVLEVGAVFVPINPLTKTDKLAYLLNDAGAACLIASASLSPVFLPAMERNDSLHTCIVAGEPPPAASDRCRIESLARIFETEASSHRDPGTIDQDLASIIYTSGSTGEPKGVMLTHLNMVTAANSVSGYLGLRQNDVILCALPLAFDYGLYQILLGFKAGATVVLERSFAFPIKILETMQRERVTVFPGVPTMFATLLRLSTVHRYDSSHLRMITNTAAALAEQQIHQLRTLFPGAILYSMYGLTECKRVSYLPPDELDRRPTSIGRGMPNQEVYLVDEAGHRLPPGSQGELVIRGSHVMHGYWGKPAETAERLRPGPIPGEFVLYSGDLFRSDPEGYLYFVGRKDDIIKSRGEKVSPREVENVLYGIEGVLEAAVIGVPDDLLGQAVKAYVVLKPDYRYSPQEIIRHCLAKLESFMVPKHVEFVSELPRTDTGKIKKSGLI